jgi:hypothetical protein
MHVADYTLYIHRMAHSREQVLYALRQNNVLCRTNSLYCRLTKVVSRSTPVRWVSKAKCWKGGTESIMKHLLHTSPETCELQELDLLGEVVAPYYFAV